VRRGLVGSRELTRDVGGMGMGLGMMETEDEAKKMRVYRFVSHHL